MECSTEHFVRALKSAHHSTNVVMKLTKKQEMPFLSLHITRQSRSGKPFVLVQDIPVCILQDTRIQELQEPLIPGADVNIVLPRLSHFKPLMDRIKSISLPLTLYANNHGELGIRAVNDGVRVETCYRDLVNPSLSNLPFPEYCLVCVVMKYSYCFDRSQSSGNTGNVFHVKCAISNTV